MGTTRSLGCSAPLLLAPAEGWGALWALLGAFSPLFSSRRCKRRHSQFSVSFGIQSIHFHAAKMEVITQKILEMNTRGDSKIKEGERGG